MPSVQQVKVHGSPRAGTAAWLRGLTAQQLAFLTILMAVLLPMFGWAAWLLAGLPGEHVPKTASLLGLMLGKINQLPGWATVAALNMVAWYLRPGARYRIAAWINFVPYVLLGAGLILFYVGLALTDAAGGQRWWEIAASACLLAAVLLTAGQILWLLWGRPGGMRFAHLFVIVAVEWLLVFGSADLFLRLHFIAQTAVAPAARFRLLEISMLGVLANVVFALGVHTWPGLFGLGRLRPRAWLLTLIVYNSGMVLLALGTQWAGVIGTVLMLVGALFFLVGLGLFSGAGGKATRLGHGTTLAGILWLMASLSFLVAFIVVQGPAPTMGLDAFGQAVEYALAGGFFGVLVVGIGVRLIQAYLPAALVPRGFLAMIVWTFGIATAVREILALAAIPGIVMSPEEATPANLYYAMAVCAAVQCAGTIALGMVILRTVMAARSETQGIVTGAWRLSDVEARYPAIAAVLAEAKIPPVEADQWTLGTLAALLGRAPEELITSLQPSAA